MKRYNIQFIFMNGDIREFDRCSQPVDVVEGTYGVLEADDKTLHLFPVATVREVIQVKHVS